MLKHIHKTVKKISNNRRLSQASQAHLRALQIEDEIKMVKANAAHKKAEMEEKLLLLKNELEEKKLMRKLNEPGLLEKDIEHKHRLEMKKREREMLDHIAILKEELSKKQEVIKRAASVEFSPDVSPHVSEPIAISTESEVQMPIQEGIQEMPMSLSVPQPVDLKVKRKPVGVVSKKLSSRMGGVIDKTKAISQSGFRTVVEKIIHFHFLPKSWLSLIKKEEAAVLAGTGLEKGVKSNPVAFSRNTHSKNPDFSATFLSRISNFFKRRVSGLLGWLEVSVPRWRPILGTFVFVLFFEVLLLYGGARVFAATFTFTQTDWSGGASGTTATHPGDQSSWTKYSSTNMDAGTSGQVTLTNFYSSYSQTFDTNGFADKDTASTSAKWDTSGTVSTLPNDPIANWKFNSSSGASATDSSGNSRTGTLTNFACTTLDCNASSGWTASGKLGNGMNFDGSNDLITTASEFIGTSDVSVAAWIKPNTVGGGGIGGEIIFNNAFRFSMRTSNNLGFKNNNGVVNQTGSNSIILSPVTWQHVVVTRTGNTVKMYIGGASACTAPCTNSDNPTAGNQNIAIGNNNAATAGFDGAVDDFRIYNRVLTDTEVSQIWNNDTGYEIVSNDNVAQSLTVDNVSGSIVSATLTGTASGTVTYQMTNDGVHWKSATSGELVTFDYTGSDLRFKATLASGATLDAVGITYGGYQPANLTSSAYDSTDAANLVTKIAWTPGTETGTDRVKFQIRSASSSGGLSSATWCGYVDTGSSCTGSNYFTTAHNNVSVASGNPLRSGGDDRWFQYRIVLDGTSGASTATINDVTITYVVNAAPDFNSTNGLVVSQVSDSADSNWGKVSIAYSIRDIDTTTGTANPGYITPTFQYNIGGSWVNITSGYLNSGATTNKAVDGSSYTTYTAYWDAQTQIPATYYATAQVRVTLNDNEAANNTVSSTSSNFAVDTKVPVVSAFRINSVTDLLTLTSIDDSVLQYRISNNADFSVDGLNGTSGAWQSPTVNSISLTPSWSMTGSPSYETVYLQVRDVLGNVSSATAVAPSTLDSMYIKDITNIEAENYKEFVSWGVFTPTSGSAFSKYQIYRSMDNSNFSQTGSDITDVSVNYYVDQSVSADTTYYYKVRVVDTDTDTGNYSTAVSDLVDGQGGSDVTAPTISAVAVSEEQATYATITWTTDELANSEVDYSTSPSTAFGSSVSVESFVTDHSVTITGLSPNTTYLFRVKSSDVLSNDATEDNSGAGFTINSAGGPVISNVTETTVDEHIATIFWNTNTDSDSHVSYSTNASLSSPTRVGSNSLVGGTPYQHKVTISSLSPGTKYYYFVESKDGSNNTSKDTNGNNYYSFVTTSDAKPPVISDVSVPVSGLTAAVVVWSTDEDATGIVDYGTASGVYTGSTNLDSSLSTFHIGALSGLVEDTKYYYRVRSTDNAGNEATSAEKDFDTDETHTVTVTVSGGGGGGGASLSLDTTPPVISGVQTKDVKSFGATISFTTSEDAVGIVHYYPKLSPDKGSYTSEGGYGTTHNIDLTGLVMGTTYQFEIKAIDKAGQTSTSNSQIFTTQFFTQSTINIKDVEMFQKEIEDAIQSALPSLVPPFIEKPQIVNITDNSATVVWKTNVNSYGSVAYADENSYAVSSDDPYLSEVADTTIKVTNHSIDLINLKPNTRYHIMARSFSLPEVVGRSSDLTFITEALKINANVSNITNNSFQAVWNTTEPTTSVVEYKNLKTGESNQKSSEVKTKTHDILVGGLVPGSSYSVNVFGYNNKGNKVSIASAVKITTSIDTKSPVITSLTINSAIIPGPNSRTQTIVSWKTDEPSTSTVYFKEGASLPDEKLINKVEITNSLVVDHSVVVSSLKAGGLYSIQVASTDDAGNQTMFPIRTAVIPEQGQSVVEIIFKNFEETFRFLKQ